MHLIITALDKNFNDNEECLLLGNWCLKGEGTIDKSKYNIVPYHWKDLVKAENDSSYLYDVYKRVMMPELSIIMNKLHRVDHSERYWMVLLGPWLWHFICTLYDRYLSIITADRLYSNLETNTVDQMFCPVTYSEWYQLITSDKYNLIIFSDILKHTNNSILCDTEYKGARVYSSVRHKKGNNLDLSIISFLKKIKYLAYLKINSIRRIAAKLRNKIVVDLGVQISRQERKDLFS